MSSFAQSVSDNSDTISEATVASPAFDGRPDCQCLGTKANLKVPDDRHQAVRLSTWVDNGKGAPPAIDATSTN